MANCDPFKSYVTFNSHQLLTFTLLIAVVLLAMLGSISICFKLSCINTFAVVTIALALASALVYVVIAVVLLAMLVVLASTFTLVASIRLLLSTIAVVH